MKDALIVLGGGINTDGTLPPDCEYRVKKAVQLYQMQEAPRIIFSSKWSFLIKEIPRCTIAEAMKQKAIALGVPPNAILTESDSVDTIGNACFTKVEFLAPNQWHNVMVVTSDFHMARSQYLFNKILGPDYSIQYETCKNGLDHEQLIKRKNWEIKLLLLSKQLLDTIPDGDHQAIDTFLSTQHPGYAKNPSYSIDQMLHMIEKQRVKI